MARLALILLALAIASGALLFGGVQAQVSIVLDAAFIVCTLAFVTVMVMLVARKARSGLHNVHRRGPDDEDSGFE